MAFGFNEDGSKASIDTVDVVFNQSTMNNFMNYGYNPYTLGSTANVAVKGKAVQFYAPFDSPSNSWSAGVTNKLFSINDGYRPACNYTRLRVLGFVANDKPYKEIGDVWIDKNGNASMIIGATYSNKRIYIEGMYLTV